MRSLLAAAILLLVATPAASASGSAVSLSGPSSMSLAHAAEVPLRARLLLEGVACREEALVPVSLRIVRAAGVDATLDVQRFLVRMPAGMDTREASTVVTLALAPRAGAGEGAVEVAASYVLPPECVAIDGPSQGEDVHRIRLHVAEAPSQAALAQEDQTRPITLKREVPGPIVACAAAALGGAVLVALRRVRDARRGA